MSLAVMDALMVSMSLLAGRHVFGHVFSSDKKTIEYVAKMAPLVSISIILDSLQGVLSGSRFFPISFLKHKLVSNIQLQVVMPVHVVLFSAILLTLV